jgi:hypothetical protein
MGGPPAKLLIRLGWICKILKIKENGPEAKVLSGPFSCFNLYFYYTGLEVVIVQSIFDIKWLIL